MQATKAKRIAPAVTLRSVQALGDLSGSIRQACCCMSTEVALAMQDVTHGWPKFQPHSVESSKTGTKYTGSFDFKQVFRVVASQRVNYLKTGVNKTYNVLIKCKMQELWVCTSPCKQLDSYHINGSLIPNAPYCYTLKLPRTVHIFRK